MTADADCLRKYAESRDQSAFSEFVHRNVDSVYSAAFRQTGGDVHLAEDVVQEVFVAAAQKAAALSRHPVIGAWLFQATRYTTADAVRSRRRRHSRESVAGQMVETSPATSPQTDWDKISPELDEMVASLGERDRIAVILRFFDGKSFADIGAELNLSENAARMRLDRALEKLRSRLSRKGVTSSCEALGALLIEKGVMAAPAGLSTAATAAALSAPAAVGLSVALGTLQIMTTTKISLGVAAIVTVLSLAAAVHEYHHAQTAELALADAARARPVARPQAGPAVPSASSQPARPGVDAAKSGAGPRRSGNPMASLIDLLGNPAMQQQTGMLARMRLDGQYGSLFKDLGLTPDQINQFKSLLVEKEMVGFDSMSAAHEQGIYAANDPRGLFQAVAAAEKTVDAQISSLLGPDGYSQFQQYQETIPARNTGMLLSQALSYTATPLTDAQSASVIRILSQYGTPALPPNNPFAVLNGDLGVVQLSDQGLAQIQGVLSAQQVQALQEKIQQHAQILQARLNMSTKP
jgi:RNA polymerase sigma factor (sigma-70 family)